ncbi:hypothetical protein XANCAGTX0491_008832 [Xanthoria calcicola]
MLIERQFVPRAKASLYGNTSLVVTCQLARDELEVLFPQGTAVVRQRSTKASIRYEHCEMIWTLLECREKISGPDPIIKHREIKMALQKLEKTIPVKTQVPRPQTLKAGHRPDVGSSSTVIMANLAIGDEDRQKYLNRWKSSVGVAPTTGPVASPVVVWGENLLTLAGERWLDDNVVDAYLSLVCHHGNGHFKLDDDIVFQEGSPNWHAWPAVTFDQPVRPSAMWPPNLYDGAKPQDVKYHFFPWCHNGHWSLFHVFFAKGRWHLDFYNSIPGYNENAVDGALSTLVSTLKEFSEGRLDLSTVTMQTPEPQPRQINSSDCGVIVINVARWLLEGWDLSTLRVNDCRRYRERMIVELEKWILI